MQRCNIIGKMDDLKSWIRNNGRPEIGSLDEQILIAIMKVSNVSDEILGTASDAELALSHEKLAAFFLPS